MEPLSWPNNYMGRSLRKHVFGSMRTIKAQISASMQSGQGFRYSLTESFDTIECIKGKQMPRWNLAHTQYRFISEYGKCPKISNTVFHTVLALSLLFMQLFL